MAQTREYNPADVISEGKAVLGVEFGSTRIKATLIGPDYRPIASGSHTWENQLKDGIWTYPMEEAWSGLAAAFSDLTADVKKQYGVQLSQLAAAGFSGMMHGYIPLDKDDNLLVPFRTWRNNITEVASTELSELFQFPIPQRWSIAHLFQAIINGEEHVGSIARLTTLAGYIHYKLTGEFALGLDEASGMFPVDPKTLTYDAKRIEQFDSLVADRGVSWKLADILPKVVPAGESAGVLSEDGAKLLDPSGTLAAGAPICPPEGDAGTGMVATNSVRPRTGNVSAGTSAFTMVVLESSLSGYHPELDIVLTPDGSPVGMAHSNNCTSDFDAWMSLFSEAAGKLGASVNEGDVFARLMPLATGADNDAGGITVIPYVSGEHVTGFSEGRPMVVRSSDTKFTLANFVRAHLFSALSAMRTGLNVLFDEEGVKVDEIRGHGGFFKTPKVGQQMMAAATNSKCSVMETAGEGGSWGMALLAAYMVERDSGQSLPDYLDSVFADAEVVSVDPDPADVEGFNTYHKRYTAALAAERAAVDNLT